MVSVGDRWEFEEPAAKSGVFTAGEFRLKKTELPRKTDCAIFRTAFL